MVVGKGKKEHCKGVGGVLGGGEGWWGLRWCAGHWNGDTRIPTQWHWHPPARGKKTWFSFKKCKGNSVTMNQKNPGYSVGVHCNIVIVETNIVCEGVKGNKKFSQSINQSILV
jgi:hypothetical protein